MNYGIRANIVMRRNEINMLSGPIVKGLLAIAIPIMVMNVGQSLFNIIDMTILKNYGTSESLVGAVGACGMLINLITGLLVGCATGTNIAVARYISQGSREHVEKAVGTSLLIAVMGGALLLVTGVYFAETFLKWTNCLAELLHDAVLYFRLYFVGVPILMVYNFARQF